MTTVNLDSGIHAEIRIRKYDAGLKAKRVGDATVSINRNPRRGDWA